MVDDEARSHQDVETFRHPGRLDERDSQVSMADMIAATSAALTLGAVLVALFQDHIRQFFWRPKSRLTECHSLSCLYRICWLYVARVCST